MSQARRRRAVTDVFLTELLSTQLAEWEVRAGRDEVQIADLGGGTGTFASVLADLGYSITVIDPSPDALASLQRRTEDRQRGAEVVLPTRIRGLQGDASELVELLGPAAVDVVICHRVLELVDDPMQALRGMAQVLTPGGVLSLVVPQRRSAVLSQAWAGHLGAARRAWRDSTRLELEQVEELISAAGFRILAAHGVGSIAGYVSESVVESDTTVFEDVLALEREVSQDPAFRALAPNVHLFAEVRTG